MFATLLLTTYTLIAQPQPADTVTVDSRQTLEQALEGTTAPDSITRQLTLVEVEYYSFDGQLHQGQLLIHRDLADDIRQVFREIKARRFPIESVIPIRFDRPNNGTSMDTLNNTYGFHYRTVNTSKSARLSAHARGRAIDINPFQNPAILRNGTVIPREGVYDPHSPGTLTRETWLTRLFRQLGWQWGGNWNSLKDYMHFEKP